MATDARTISLSRLFKKARELFTPVAQAVTNPLGFAVNRLSNVRSPINNQTLGQNFRTAMQDPGQFSLSRPIANIQPLTQKVLTPVLGQNRASNVGYGIRGASQLTPFQWANMAGIDKTGQSQYRATAPVTEQQKVAQSVGRSIYGYGLTAPLGGANLAKNVLGRVAVSTGVGAGLGAGISKLTGGSALQGAKQGAYTGFKAGPLLSITNPLTQRGITALGGGVIAQQVGGRAVGGAANTIEDEILAKMDGLKVTNKDRAFSFLVGAALTNNKMAWDQAKVKLKSMGVKNVDQVFSQAQKRVSDLVENSKQLNVRFVENGKAFDQVMDKKTAQAWSYYLASKGIVPEIRPLGLEGGFVQGKVDQPPKLSGKVDPLSSLKQEAKKYKIIKQEGVFEVNGKPVKIADGLDTFVHEGTGGFVVSEASSGQYMADGRTVKEAVANAKKAVSDIGIDKVKQIISGKQLNQSTTPKVTTKLQKTSNNQQIPLKQASQTFSDRLSLESNKATSPKLQTRVAQTLADDQAGQMFQSNLKPSQVQSRQISQLPTQANKITSESSNSILSQDYTLKPKTKLLEEAKRLRSIGSEQLSANKELAQMNSVKREMFSDKQIKDINRLKTIARSNKALEGDVETLRSMTPDGLTDRVLEYVEEATAIKGQGNEEQLLEMALNLPSKLDAKVKLPTEILNARELEKQAKQVRDLVFNSETDLPTKTKVIADNQKLIEKSAISDFKEWEKQLFKQETAKTMTSNRLAGRVATSIKTSTVPEFAKPENIFKTRDISNSGKGMTDIYRNVDRVFGKNSSVRKTILEPFDTAKAKMVDDLETVAADLDTNIVKKYGFKKGSTESEHIQKYGEKLVTKGQLIEKFGQEKANQIVEADKWFRGQYDKLLDEVNAARARIYPNNPDMQIPKRKDYYRHFQDISGTMTGLKNLFENSAGIDPSLAGMSEYVKPKSKWLSFAQKRLGIKTEYDAVGGYLDYAGAQTYAKRVDPFIDKFRKLREELVNATSTEGDPSYGKLNNFIEFLDDYANDLAGKTNPADRALQKYIGRKPFKILNWLNSRTKANVIVGNLSSSIAQFFNIPQGVAEAGLLNSGKGAVRTMGSILDNNSPMKQSEFIKTRYMGDISDRFDEGILSSTKKAASWITGIGDEIGTKFIWNSVYEQALSKGIDNPIKYTDDITRKMVAGRGIGEVPLLQKSKVFQLVAPFQLEVSNVWHVMKDWAGEKAAGKFVTFFVASYLMNQMAKKVRGSDVSFDPIQAGIEAFDAYGEEEDKGIGVLRASGRLLGEILSNVPGGQTIAAMYPEYGTTLGETKLPTRKDLFGQGDPTRFGGGLLASKAITDPLYNLIPPFGGAQIKKTIQGLGTVKKGYSETTSGRVRFPVEQNLRNTLQAGTFGQYAVPEAREYFDQKQSALGDKQTDAYKKILETQGVGPAKTFYDAILNKRGKSEVTGEGETSDDLAVIQSKFDNAPQLLTPQEIATYYESKVTKPTTKSAYQQAVYEDEIWDQISNINSRDTLTQEQKDDASMALLSKIGVAGQDYQYYTVAKQTNDLKSLYAEEELTKMMASGASKEEIYQWMIDSRREVNGKQLLAPGVIDNLVDKNIISYYEGKQLKAIKVEGTGTKKKATTKVSKKKVPKPKKVSFKSLKPPKIKIVKVKKFSAPKVKKIKIKRFKIKMPSL